MTYAALEYLKKNSPPAKLTVAAESTDTTFTVDHLEYFHNSTGGLITKSIIIDPGNVTETKPEEITITAASTTSGPGDITGIVRGVHADGTIGVASSWDSGTEIAVNYTYGRDKQIADNFAAHQTILAVMPNRNAIINGDCRVNQRGTAYTLVKDAYSWDSNDLTGPDRHEGMATGTAVSAGTFGQSTTSLAGSSGYGFRFSGVTLTGAGVLYHRYRMEGKDAARFKNQTASFSCKVYHDVGSAINYTVYIRKANSADNFGAVTAISNSGAQSIATGTDTSLNYEAISMGDCSAGIEIEIKIECGAVTTKNFYLSEMQFEHGSATTTFEFKQYAIELATCQRYFIRYNSIASQYSFISLSAGYTSTLTYAFLDLMNMRAIPSVAYWADIAVTTGAADFAVTNITIYTNGSNLKKAWLIITVGSGLSAGQLYYIRSSSKSGDIFLAAEL